MKFNLINCNRMFLLIYIVTIFTHFGLIDNYKRVSANFIKLFIFMKLTNLFK